MANVKSGRFVQAEISTDWGRGLRSPILPTDDRAPDVEDDMDAEPAAAIDVCIPRSPPQAVLAPPPRKR